jgi:hypothetical protein
LIIFPPVNKSKVTAEDFIDFLVATQVNPKAKEAQGPARLLHRLEPSNDILWLEMNAGVSPEHRFPGAG